MQKNVILATVVILLTMIASPWLYVQINKQVYKTRVIKYLVKDQGYQKEDIRSVRGVWGIKLPPFYTVVVFNDEPLVEYVYFAHNSVLQFDYRITDEGQQRGITEADLKHHAPH